MLAYLYLYSAAGRDLAFLGGVFGITFRDPKLEVGVPRRCLDNPLKTCVLQFWALLLLPWP